MDRLTAFGFFAVNAMLVTYTLDVWSWGKVVRVDLKCRRLALPSVADVLERRFPFDGFEVFGEIVG